jgi:hypothetical protein
MILEKQFDIIRESAAGCDNMGTGANSLHIETSFIDPFHPEMSRIVNRR